MATQTKLKLPNEVIVEITKRSTDPEDDSWARYLLLLQVANDILVHAPRSAQECEEFDILKRLGDDLEAMTTLIHRLFPGGLKEAWYYYLPERLHQPGKNGSG